MNVSSYLEGFLTVYGWMLYETLYQLFSMLWLVFLPFVMLFYNFFKETIIDTSNGGYAHFKSSIFSACLMLLILFFCLVPIGKIKIEGSKLNTVCNDNVEITSFYNKSGVNNAKKAFKFDVTKEGRVPILPLFVMRLAQGTNNVIYKYTPCVSKVTNLALAFDTTRLKDPGLKDQVLDFTGQCYRKARTRLNDLETLVGKGTKNKIAESFAKTYATRLGKTWAGIGSITNGVDNEREIRFQEEYMGSDLMLYMMDADSSTYSKISAYLSNPQLLKWKEFATTKLYSDSPVDGISSTHPDASSHQKSNNLGPVLCSAWWKKVKPKLSEEAVKELTINLVKTDEAAKKCWVGNEVFDPLYLLSPECETYVKESYKMDNPLGYEEKTNDIIFKSQTTASGYAALSNSENTVIAAAAAAGSLGSVLGFVPGLGNNALENITKSAVSFYGEMFMYKIVLKFLQPMLLMGIFTFWALYLIVSSYRGETVFKGLVLIYSITLLPSIWAIADHIDGSLYQALFPYNDVVGYSNKSSSTIERMVLDGASTVFYVIFPFILLYMVSEAGGPRGGDAFRGTDGQSRGIGGTTGNLGGSVSIASNESKKSYDRYKSD